MNIIAEGWYFKRFLKIVEYIFRWEQNFLDTGLDSNGPIIDSFIDKLAMMVFEPFWGYWETRGDST